MVYGELRPLADVFTAVVAAPPTVTIVTNNDYSAVSPYKNIDCVRRKW
jgi:hypothetical protein